ncbi:hypothetical protein Glove_166g199 [Diversispora epigaea]|uniref:Protein MON2 homolog n=1 Tax=Diversispora epigaea TaxID=1348612 RepID=A0A397J037_9GLOM|nr:hypothetical protein Glove_166g199 [Diversispora epigaea]
MSGLTTSLNAELLQLSNEARRKHPEIKEAAERSIIVLRTLKERPGKDISQELAKNTDFLRPFLLACDSKHVKLITISIGCLHKLISHHAIPESSVKTILKTLNDIMSQGVEIQLKILQTVPPLLSNYQALHGDLLAEALLICFRIQDSKVVVVNNTAAATLRQLVINIFEKVQEEDEINEKNGSVKPTSTVVSIIGEGVVPLRPCARDAYFLFQDLCLLTNAEPPVYLRLHGLSRTFGLELIESVLTNHSKLFKTHSEFSLLLRERVCPLIIKNFSEKSDFPTTMRLMRVVYILFRQFNDILVMECEIFLTMFIKNLEPDTPLWQRVISMEIFRGICADASLLRSIYHLYDKQGQSTHIFQDMVNGFKKLATEKPQALGVGSHSLVGHLHQGRESMDLSGITGVVVGGSGQVDSAGLNVLNSTMKVECIDQLDKVDPPPIPETYLYYLALLCLSLIADSLHSFISTIFSEVIQKQFEKKSQERKTLTLTFSAESSQTQQPTIFGYSTLKLLEDHPSNKEILLVTEMANTAWPGLLAALSFFLTTNLDEELFSGVLRSFQNFTIVCGVLQLSTPRDAFLTSLSKGAVPPSVVTALSAESKAVHTSSGTSGTTNDGSPLNTLSDRNLSCLKILLNVAQYLGGVLGESWYLILETLQLADLILFPKHARGARIIGSQNAASVSVTSLSSPITAGSSNSSLQTSTTPPNINKRFSLGATQSTSIGSSSQAGSSSTYLSSQQTAIENHLSVLFNQIKKLFDNCKYLDDDALQFFTRSLCKLNAYTWGLPWDEDNPVISQETVSMEGKAPKSIPLSTLRGNKSDEKSFAIDKLHSVALSNLHSMIAREPTLIWDLIVSHLITTANYVSTPQQIRKQACKTLDDIIIASMSYASSIQLESDERIQMQLLVSLNQLINNPNMIAQNLSKGFYVNVQKRGLETLNKLLQTSGHSFIYGWGMIFDMIKNVCVANSSGESKEEGDSVGIDNTFDASSFGVSNNNKTSGLVRVAFPSLQLICTDFLSLLSPECLKQCINTLGAFGLQIDDLNISLTALGLLWNVSDHIQTKRSELEKNFGTNYEKSEIIKDMIIEQEIERAIQGELSPQTMNALWMLILLQLSKICSDVRPQVRNGANQTLFRTIDMNGAVLESQTWHTCIWKVLFPLLDSIKQTSEKVVKAMQQQQQTANSEKIMVHHTRNTVDKQWDETKVLVLTGMSGIIKNFLPFLINLEDFKQAWELFLSHLQDSCLYSSLEVALAAIKSLNTMIQFPEDEIHSNLPKENISLLWKNAWITWERIGLGIITPINKQNNNNNNNNNDDDDNNNDNIVDNVPTSHNKKMVSSQFNQETLTAYIIAFGDLYKTIRSDFSIKEIKRLLKVVYGILTYPNSPSYRPDHDYLTPLQEAILDVMGNIDLSVPDAPAAVLRDLAKYITLAFVIKPPQNEIISNLKMKKQGNSDSVVVKQRSSSNNTKSKKSETTVSTSKKSYENVTFIVFSKTVMRNVQNLFKKFVKDKGIYSEGVFERIIWAYGIPMKLKYNCPPSGKHIEDIELWKIATTAFLEIVKDGLIAFENFGDEISKECFVNVWKQLTEVIHGTLISNCHPPSVLKTEQQDADEAFDMRFLFSLQSDVMIHMGPRVPQTLIKKIVEAIQEGSQLYFTGVKRREIVNGFVNESSSNNNDDDDDDDHNNNDDDGYELNKVSEKVEGITTEIIPVARERFAYACLQCLFDLCSDGQNDEVEIRQRIAAVAAPILLERCASVIRNYTADQSLLGKYPFPRSVSELSWVRNDEILLVLQQSIKLRFRLNILKVDENITNPLTKQVLSGQSAHLFYLYPVICGAISLPDENIVGLLKECLRKIGEELGV